MSVLSIVLLAAWLLVSPFANSWGKEAEVEYSYPWERIIVDQKTQRDALSSELEQIHGTLSARARAVEARALLERLSPKPPRPQPQGYGALPVVQKDQPKSTITPSENTYSLSALGKWLVKDLQDSRSLYEKMILDQGPALEWMVSEFERLRARLDNVETHLAYHEKWQRALITHPDYFREKNKAIAIVREMMSVGGDGQEPDHVSKLQEKMRQHVMRFTPTHGLRIESDADGTHVMTVTVLTDIDDATFLNEFRQGVEAAFSHSAAARNARFKLVLTIDRIPSSTLYPQGAPVPESTIDMNDHLDRFPKDALVVTTGAKETYANVGRNISLGPTPVSRRVLAHEFGHLLGFSDAYLRGYDGDPRDPYGAVIIEWTGLVNDLMGNPDGGTVTHDMIKTLMDAYGT